MIRSLLILFLSTLCGTAQHRLDIRILPSMDSLPLAFDTLALETDAAAAISITRCDLLLSGAALQRADGSWIGPATWAAFINTRERRNDFALTRIPAGIYQRLRFQIGLPRQINLGDPAKYPAGHALNPLVNGMHWGWQGGYVFAAVEGLWRGANGKISGYSYHLANEENLMTVELPIDLDLSRDHTLSIDFNVARFFKGFRISPDRATTHSRAGDPIAAELSKNLAASFEIAGLAPTPTREEAAARTSAVIAPGATPYRFSFSSTFPHPSLPLDNPLTNEGVALGKLLFHDAGLSANHSQSCASCHDRQHAFSDPRKFSTGAFGDIGTRHAMPLFNLAWKSSFFWDGRAATLKQQSLEPIENPIEMHSTLPDVVRYLNSKPDYQKRFEDAFGTREISADRISRALEQFLLTLVSSRSKFDQALRGEAALTEEEQRGAALFNTEFDPERGQRGADCFHCHGGPLFQSTAFANNGLDALPADAGRLAATGIEGDRGKFSVPSLRNIALTPPYMHDGRFATLEEVISHYDHGVRRSSTLDPNLAKHPVEGLRLDEADQKALVAFLRTLTDDSFAKPSVPSTHSID